MITKVSPRIVCLTYLSKDEYADLIEQFNRGALTIKIRNYTIDRYALICAGTTYDISTLTAKIVVCGGSRDLIVTPLGQVISNDSRTGEYYWDYINEEARTNLSPIQSFKTALKALEKKVNKHGITHVLAFFKD